MNYHAIPIPHALTNYSLSDTLTSGQTFRWHTTPLRTDPDTPLSNPQSDVFYLPTRTPIDETPIVYKVIQPNNHLIEWKTINDHSVSPRLLETYLKQRLGFTFDYTNALQQLQENDTELYNDINTELSLIIDPPFETVISFICSPQATIDRIYTMQRKIEQKYGTKISTTEGDFYLFPTPKQLSNATEDDLRDLGLGYRAPYVARTVKKILDNTPNLPNQQTTQPTIELTTQLQEFVGVGEKVADCIALYAYGRSEIIPIDTRIQQMVQNRYDETSTTPAKAKQTLNKIWEQEFAGYYQLLLYELAATEL